MQSDKQLPRRRFLKATASLGAGVAAGLTPTRADAALASLAAAGKAGEGKPEKRNAQEGILYKRLGRTNFMVSALSFGGVGMNESSLPVFDQSVGRGVNFIMAHGGSCTKVLGKWFQTKGNRERIFLGLQGGVGNIDRALKTMGTDHVDLLMMCSHKPDGVGNESIRRQFEALKKAGKARYLCLVFHSNLPAVWKEGVKAGWYDALLAPYAMPSRKDLKPLIASAKAKDIGLLTMKAARALPKGTDFVAAGRTFLADGMATVLKTMRKPNDLKKYMPLAAKAGAKLAQIDCAGQCTLCGACSPCPAGVAIQDILRTYQYYVRDLGWMDRACRQYAAIGLGALAPACTDCGQCEDVCPQHLPIRQLIREAHVELELELARG